MSPNSETATAALHDQVLAAYAVAPEYVPPTDVPTVGAFALGRVCLADVQPEAVRWLWPARIPLGKLSIIDGDPSLGKSMLTLDLAARLSTGAPMPDGSIGDVDGPVGVVILSAEDGLADTIRPRLNAAHADPSRIVARSYVHDGVMQRLPTLADLDILEADIVETAAKFVIIDPLMAYLPAGVQTARDNDVRRALAPLAQIAERTGAAILVVRHLNKSGLGSPMYRGGGSIGIIGAARSALLVAPDPDDPADPKHKRRILALTKSNLAELPTALAYRVTGADNGAARIVWEGATEHTAATLLAVPSNPEDQGALTEAKEFLSEQLADGPVPADEVFNAAKQAKIAEPTVKRAKRALGITSRREGGVGSTGRWVWEWPQADSAKGIKESKEDQLPEDDPLSKVDPLSRDQPAPYFAANGYGDLPLARERANGSGP